MPQAERFAHGIRARYVSGCRCDECRKANREYGRLRAKAIIFHGKNDLVVAQRARTHLLILSRNGVGRRAVAAASDVSETVLTEIRSMRKLSIRRATETRILSVTAEAIANHGLIDARRTWNQINHLLREGFTKAELARRLGYKSHALQLNPETITAINATRIDRFYRQIMAGAEEEAA
jgi:hypothetical protein